ncbi:MAG: D-hexose-6-phosphate mutarotase [Cellvibrionaceae bacterium]
MNDSFRPLVLTHPSGATASLCAYGAHVTSWKLANGKEKLFLSSQAKFEQGKSIRGGVPIIFPQFNEFGHGQRHGFARTSQWEIRKEPTENNDKIECQLEFNASDETRQSWPYRFKAIYTVVLSENSLSLTLSIENLDETPFSFTAALHSYFNISQLRHTELIGLKDTEYWSNDGSEFSCRYKEKEDDLFISDALDRVYFNVASALKLKDLKNGSLHISQTGFNDVVVWNPGKAAAVQMQDMANEEYQHMLCVEAAVIDNPVVLNPNEKWKGVQYITAEKKST